jgi:glycine cleavage system H protein
MKLSTISRPRINFTQSHEWIAWNGSVGFVGVSAYRLKEVKKITDIKYFPSKSTVERGTLIAEIHTAEEIIPVLAPVACKFLGQNQQLKQNPNLIIESPQDNGWVFFVSPVKFGTQESLLSPEAYKKFTQTIVTV